MHDGDLKAGSNSASDGALHTRALGRLGALRGAAMGDHAPNDTHDVNGLKVNVDPRSREVLSDEPRIVPGNRVAVPAPWRA